MRRYRHVIKFILLSAALFILLSACSGGGEANQAAAEPFPTTTPFVSARAGKEAHRDTVFTVDYNFSAGLNPYSCSDGTNLILTGLVYEPLFAVARDFSYEPVLVSDWSGDGVDFQFTIKSGVVFHDGSELTVWDALYSVNLARASARFKTRLSIISEAWIENGRLNIALNTQDADFPVLLDIPVVKDGGGYEDVPAGTGPYRLGEYGGAVFLKAFEAHRDYGSLPLGRIYLKEYEPEELVAAYEEELIDLVVTNPFELGEPEFGGSSELRKVDTTVLHYLGVNGESPFFAEFGRRRLVASAIDREGLAEDIIGGRAALLPVSPASKYYFGDIAEKAVFRDLPAALIENLTEDYDGDGVLEYLDGGVRELTLRFIACNEDPARLMAARKAASDLKAAGFDVDFRELGRQAFFDALYLGDFDLYYGEIRLKADFDLGQLLSPGGGASYGLADPSIAGLIRGFLAASGEAKEAAARELYSHIAETCPLIPLAFEQEQVLVHRGRVSGMEPTCQNVFNGIAGWTVNLQ
jgi:peptide/nickel transport system substrate-binding protein